MTPLFDWLPGFRRRRERAAAHAAAWAQEARTDGLKPFQVVAKERLDKVLTAIGAPIQWSIERTDSQEWGQSLVGRATTISLTVWLHDDTFSFTAGEKGDYLEWWDYDSPTAMIDEFSSRVEAEVRLHGMG